MESIDGFPIVVRQPVQWGEQDAFGHVNNVHFIRWLETARVAYMQACKINVSSEGVGPILAAVNCNYRRQVKHPDEMLIGTRIGKTGTTSLRLDHEIWSKEQQVLVADGTSIVVVFDYSEQKPVPLTDELRKTIEMVEGRKL